MNLLIGVASVFITLVCLAILKNVGGIQELYHKWNWQL